MVSRALQVLFKVCLVSIFLLVACVFLLPLETGQLLDELLNVLSGSAEYTANVSTRRGVLTPVETEILEPMELTLVQGGPPSDMNGVFLRVGPNELLGRQHGRMAYHLFDGHGMVHAVRVRDGKATYTRSWLHTPRFLLEQAQGRDVLGRMGNLFMPWLPLRLLAQAIKYRSHHIPALRSHTGNTNIMLWGTRLYALNEAGLPFEFSMNPHSGAISSIGYNDLGNHLDQAVTAHPRSDPHTGTIVFASYNAKTCTFPVGEIRASDNALLSLRSIQGRKHSGAADDNNKTDTASPAIGWAHDAALTPNYVVIPDGGSVFTIDNLKRGVFVDLASTLGFTIVARDNSTTFTVASDRKESIVHIATAWETSDSIVVAAPVSADLKGIPVNQDTLQYIQFKFAKITLPKHRGTLQIELIHGDDRCSPEFPRVHPDWDASGRPVRFAFASCVTPTHDAARAGAVHFNAWAKFDLESMQMVDYIQVPSPWVIGELAPVSKLGPSSGNNSSSDAVWLMGSMVNVETLQSRIVLYDGQTPSEQSVATWELQGGERIPAGFHSQWYHTWQLLGQPEPQLIMEEQRGAEKQDQEENQSGGEEVAVEDEITHDNELGKTSDDGEETTGDNQMEAHEEL